MCVSAGGCAQPAKPSAAEWFAWVRDGHTTREELLLRLGRPTGQYEGERILVFTTQLGTTTDDLRPMWRALDPLPQQYPVIVQDTCHLVSVFDPSGVLCRHSVVAVSRLSSASP
jgi:hypothetical protein